MDTVRRKHQITNSELFKFRIGAIQDETIMKNTAMSVYPCFSVYSVLKHIYDSREHEPDCSLVASDGEVIPSYSVFIKHLSPEIRKLLEDQKDVNKLLKEKAKHSEQDNIHYQFVETQTRCLSFPTFSSKCLKTISRFACTFEFHYRSAEQAENDWELVFECFTFALNYDAKILIEVLEHIVLKNLDYSTVLAFLNFFLDRPEYTSKKPNGQNFTIHGEEILRKCWEEFTKNKDVICKQVYNFTNFSCSALMIILEKTRENRDMSIPAEIITHIVIEWCNSAYYDAFQTHKHQLQEFYSKRISSKFGRGVAKFMEKDYAFTETEPIMEDDKPKFISDMYSGRPNDENLKNFSNKFIIISNIHDMIMELPSRDPVWHWRITLWEECQQVLGMGKVDCNLFYDTELFKFWYPEKELSEKVCKENPIFFPVEMCRCKPDAELNQTIIAKQLFSGTTMSGCDVLLNQENLGLHNIAWKTLKFKTKKSYKSMWEFVFQGVVNVLPFKYGRFKLWILPLQIYPQNRQNCNEDPAPDAVVQGYQKPKKTFRVGVKCYNDQMATNPKNFTKVIDQKNLFMSVTSTTKETNIEYRKFSYQTFTQKWDQTVLVREKHVKPQEPFCVELLRTPESAILRHIFTDENGNEAVARECQMTQFADEDLTFFFQSSTILPMICGFEHTEHFYHQNS